MPAAQVERRTPARWWMRAAKIDPVLKRGLSKCSFFARGFPCLFSRIFHASARSVVPVPCKTLSPLPPIAGFFLPGIY
jgi:hypothetical protein